ncbi:hypothetical protein CDAR_582981 [Caerostris darwini]|uniref:Uncharacterized protein n=1 Tax=Caerostris darwini TaxID=1538125 RepID=A0AAV4PHK2_9ARAC|nr:hypothetical protein CDAR_582981 [Caerostris darwini]
MRRLLKIRIKGLPIDTKSDDIKSELQSLGFQASDVVQLKKWRTTITFPNFFTELKITPMIADICKRGCKVFPENGNKKGTTFPQAGKLVLKVPPEVNGSLLSVNVYSSIRAKQQSCFVPTEHGRQAKNCPFRNFLATKRKDPVVPSSHFTSKQTGTKAPIKVMRQTIHFAETPSKRSTGIASPQCAWLQFVAFNSLPPLLIFFSSKIKGAKQQSCFVPTERGRWPENCPFRNFMAMKRKDCTIPSSHFTSKQTVTKAPIKVTRQTIHFAKTPSKRMKYVLNKLRKKDRYNMLAFPTIVFVMYEPFSRTSLLLHNGKRKRVRLAENCPFRNFQATKRKDPANRSSHFTSEQTGTKAPIKVTRQTIHFAETPSKRMKTVELFCSNGEWATGLKLFLSKFPGEEKRSRHCKFSFHIKTDGNKSTDKSHETNNTFRGNTFETKYWHCFAPVRLARIRRLLTLCHHY